MKFNALVPELGCADMRRSLEFYTGLLGFHIAYERPEDNFAYLEREDAQIMLEQENDTWRTGATDYPYGRGLNLQIEVADALALHERLTAAGYPVFVAPEDKWYQTGNGEVGLRQFLVLDPDGYLLRFAQSLGTRARS
jgi:catechol 2,3-dioxygenase-like lactoylglutathione lyase family enzyme